MTRTPSALPLAVLVSAFSLACTPTNATGSPPPATGGTGGNPGSSYVGRPTTGSPAPGPGQEQPRDAHHFTPRTHEAHFPPPPSSPPVLLTLPRYVDGSARCFHSPEPPHYVPYGYQGQGSTYYGGYGVGRSGSSGPSSPTASAPSPKKSASPRPTAPPPASAPPSAAESSAGSRMSAADVARQMPAPAPERRDKDDRARPGDTYAPEPAPQSGFGVPVYLSNDDTMSLSSAQRVIWAIEHFAPIPREHVRPHELLNYFSFDTQPVAGDHDFSVVANIAALDPGVARLSLAIQGRPLTRGSRRNVNLAYVVDRSGSMDAEGRMEYLKQGLLRSIDELKHGDIVHVTLFDTTVCQLAENFVVGRDDLSRLRQSISRIAPEGSTNLYDGLVQGYQVADRAYQPGYSNRVIMITDAEANTGVTDEAMVATVGQHYDARRIRLSGIGVGSTFNDSLLDQLTERGRGAYVFLGSQSEVDAVFGSRFVSLIETIAGDVHFRLHLPPTLAMSTFYGEEASTIKERVQAVHYFAGTSQLFLSDLKMQGGAVPTSDDVMLSIEYEDPESGQARVEEFAFRLGDINGRAPNLDKASYVDAFARSLQASADRPLPSYNQERYGWSDPSAGSACRDEKAAAAYFVGPIQGDPEVRRIDQLWDTFCSRYPIAVRPPMPHPQPHHPQPHYPQYDPRPYEPRHNDFAPPDTWPGATSSR